MNKRITYLCVFLLCMTAFFTSCQKIDGDGMENTTVMENDVGSESDKDNTFTEDNSFTNNVAEENKE